MRTINVTMTRTEWTQHEIEVPDDFDATDAFAVQDLHMWCNESNEIDGETTDIEIEVNSDSRD